MALRLDLYAVAEDLDLETFGPDALTAHPTAPAHGVTWVGFVSASDDDEDRLGQLLACIAEIGCLSGAIAHGVGPSTEAVDASCAARVAALPADDPTIGWRDTVAAALACVVDAGCHLGWWTRYDRGGSTSSGPDDWPTAWSSDSP
jgi:hypothetical protein